MRFIFNIPRTMTCYRWFGIFIALAIGCSPPSSLTWELAILVQLRQRGTPEYFSWV